MLLPLLFHHEYVSRLGSGSTSKKKRGKWEVDSFNDYKPKPEEKPDDEDCLILLMMK